MHINNKYTIHVYDDLKPGIYLIVPLQKKYIFILEYLFNVIIWEVAWFRINILYTNLVYVEFVVHVLQYACTLAAFTTVSRKYVFDYRE